MTAGELTVVMLGPVRGRGRVAMMRQLFASYLFAQRARKDGRAGFACYKYGIRARAAR